jgi:hypothetical protein
MNGPATIAFKDTCPTPVTQVVTESILLQQISHSLHVSNGQGAAVTKRYFRQGKTITLLERHK